MCPRPVGALVWCTGSPSKRRALRRFRAKESLPILCSCLPRVVARGRPALREGSCPRSNDLRKPSRHRAADLRRVRAVRRASLSPRDTRQAGHAASRASAPHPSVGAGSCAFESRQYVCAPSKRVPPSSRQTVPTLFRWFPSATDAMFSTASDRESPADDESFGHLLQIFPGPVHDPEEFFTERLEQLSSLFTGVVLTRGPVARTLRIGRFDVRVLPEGAPIRGGDLLAFMRAAIRVVRETRVDAVVTYDPLKSGLVGYCASRLARAPLIVEVNGDYTAEANYVDISNPVLRRLKRGVFVRLEGFVLRRAAGIKLLYPTQIDSFKPALRDQVVRTFPDFVGWRTFRDLGESPEILFVGFPYRLKGVNVLSASFKQVAEDYPVWRSIILGWFPALR